MERWNEARFAGVSFAFIGRFDSKHPRIKLAAIVEKEGGQVRANPDSQCNFVVCAERNGLTTRQEQKIKSLSRSHDVELLILTDFIERLQPSAKEAKGMLQAGSRGLRRLSELTELTDRNAIKLKGIDLCEQRLRDQELRAVQFINAGFQRADLTGTSIWSPSRCDLSDSTLKKAHLHDADRSILRRADLSGATISGSKLDATQSVMDRVLFRGEFEGCKFDGASLAKASRDLAKLTFSKSSFCRTWFR
ncbi:MAG: pentapeptide repeat-containing protein [Planctomycetota bacterium]